MKSRDDDVEKFINSCSAKPMFTYISIGNRTFRECTEIEVEIYFLKVESKTLYMW